MSLSNYTPEPLDTTGIELPQPLLDLEERLAHNTHEVWAAHRMAEGWTLGPRRDDERKQHPCLVPYDQLPESEKAYDRVLVHNTLAAAVALGYRIEPPASTPAASDSAAASQDVVRLQSSEPLDLPALLAIWQGRIVEQWQQAPDAYRLLAERLLGLGEPLLAYDVASEGRQHWPADWRLRQLEALALARSGATGRASELLQELRAEGATDEETLGMLGRTEKDFGLSAPDAQARRNHLARAARLYEESFQRHQGYWSGINAATLYLLDGEVEQANRLARAVREQCLELARDLPGKSDYWVLATLGEAALVLGDHAEASRWYSAAVATSRGRLGDVASTRRNARLLLEHLGADPSHIDDTLHIPGVALFHGGTARLDEAALHDRFQAQLARADCRLGYACITGPAEVVFLETILERGGTPYVVTPYDAEAYLSDLHRRGLQNSWLERAQSVLDQAGRLIVASPGGAAQSIAGQQFAHLLVAGLAAADARRLDTELVSLDGDAPQTPPAQAEPFPSQIVGMLFADAVHFSRLREAEVVIFSDEFMGAIGRLVQTSSYAPVFTNTWGDGLFFVFRTVADAGTFALALRDVVTTTDWVARGLPAELNLRIGLHAGPVFGSRDPVTGRAGYFGTHISRAARIEPITPPGHVYASEPFAALAELETNRKFTCEYVGQTPQAKGYGTFPTYHVRPLASPD